MKAASTRTIMPDVHTFKPEAKVKRVWIAKASKESEPLPICGFHLQLAASQRGLAAARRRFDHNLPIGQNTVTQDKYRECGGKCVSLILWRRREPRAEPCAASVTNLWFHSRCRLDLHQRNSPGLDTSIPRHSKPSTPPDTVNISRDYKTLSDCFEDFLMCLFFQQF